MSEALRIDKWLWAARFFKTRGLAQQAIEQGRVRVGDERVKPARSLRVGERLRIQQSSDHEREVIVVELSAERGPAVQAQTLYRETDESVRACEARVEARRLAPEPAQAIEGGRPTKRQRRDLDRWRGLP